MSRWTGKSNAVGRPTSEDKQRVQAGSKDGWLEASHFVPVLYGRPDGGDDRPGSAHTKQFPGQGLEDVRLHLQDQG
jgi:hypothetical protein